MTEDVQLAPSLLPNSCRCVVAQGLENLNIPFENVLPELPGVPCFQSANDDVAHHQWYIYSDQFVEPKTLMDVGMKARVVRSWHFDLLCSDDIGLNISTCGEVVVGEVLKQSFILIGTIPPDIIRLDPFPVKGYG